MGGARLVEPLPREGLDRGVFFICFSRPACFLLRTLSLVREQDGTSLKTDDTKTRDFGRTACAPAAARRRGAGCRRLHFALACARRR
jgi:hypothetical protein